MDQQFSKELELEHQPSQDKMLRLKKSPNGKEMKRPQSAPLPGHPNISRVVGFRESVWSPSIVPFTSSSRDTTLVGRDYENKRVKDMVAIIQARAEESLRSLSTSGILDDESTHLILRIEVCQLTRPATSLRGSPLKYQEVQESIADAFLSSQV
jgi:hypothetical protein